MLSLSEQLQNFLAEWDANQQLAGKAGIGPGTCQFCGRERYVQYDIMLDKLFCSAHCKQRHAAIVREVANYGKSPA